MLSSGSARFVNNHFWNCYESGTDVIVESVPATSGFLDMFFEHNVRRETQWAKSFKQPLRCRVPTGLNETQITCAPLSAAFNASIPIDYPTFNPLFKMRPDYRFFYAIGPAAEKSKWFDKIVKVDVSQGGGTVVVPAVVFPSSSIAIAYKG